MITIDLYCFHDSGGCGERAIATVSRDEAGYDVMWECPTCKQSTMSRVPSAPNIMQTAIPDGVNKKNKDFKEALRLEAESYNLDQKDRTGINAEIKKLKAVRK